MSEQTAEYRVESPEQEAANGAAPSAPAILSREDILARRGQVRRELVPVPGWGGAVYVKALTGTERDKFEDSLAVLKKDGSRDLNLVNFRAKLVARTVVDERGERLFTPGDVAALGDLDAADLQEVFNVAQRLAGMSKADVEELAGNSSPAESDETTFD